MSSFDSFGGTSSNDEFCPNCGAIKVFSALVCPSCGVNYDEAFRKKKSAEGNAQEEIVGRRFEEKPEVKDTAKQENAEDVKKPDPDDPIAKKLAEITRQNSGMMVGERRYRIDTPSDASKKPEDGSGDGSSSAPSGRSVYDQANNTYGNGNISYGASRYGGSVWQSGTSPATDHTPIGTSAKTYSNEVSNKYDEYRSDMNNPASSSQYASPYSRGAFDQVPEKKPSTLKKILPLAIILVLVGIGTGVFLWFRGLNTNENGMEYPTTVPSGMWDDKTLTFKHEWAGINIDLSAFKGERYYMTTALANKLTEEQKEQYDIPFVYVNETDPLGILVMVYKKGIFPVKDSELFNEEVGTVSGLGRNITYKNEDDALLGGYTYKCKSVEVKSSSSDMKYYYFARSIGNRAVYVIIYYPMTGTDKLGLIKSMFK